MWGVNVLVGKKGHFKRRKADSKALSRETVQSRGDDELEEGRAEAIHQACRSSMLAKASDAPICVDEVVVLLKRVSSETNPEDPDDADQQESDEGNDSEKEDADADSTIEGLRSRFGAMGPASTKGNSSTPRPGKNKQTTPASPARPKRSASASSPTTATEGSTPTGSRRHPSSNGPGQPQLPGPGGGGRAKCNPKFNSEVEMRNLNALAESLKKQEDMSEAATSTTDISSTKGLSVFQKHMNNKTLAA